MGRKEESDQMALMAMRRAESLVCEVGKPGFCSFQISQVHKRKESTITSSGLLKDLSKAVPPGQYEITAVGKNDNKEYQESKVVEIQPNAMASVEMILPVTSVRS